MVGSGCQLRFYRGPTPIKKGIVETLLTSHLLYYFLLSAEWFIVNSFLSCMCCKLEIMVLIEGSLGKIVGNESEVRGYDNDVMVVSSSSYLLRLDSSASIGKSSTEKELSDFLAFLSQLP